jgi:predicted Zn-dependent protease
MAFRGSPGLLTAVIVVALTSATVAQTAKPPKRPKLAAGADTNDARAYYDRGVYLLRREPWAAAAAFYWASRLEPGWPEAYYAQRVAGLLAQEHLLIGYLEGSRSVVRSPQTRQLDSLEYRAQRLNPFFLRDLDETLFAGYLIAIYKQQRSRAGERALDPTDEAEVRFLVDQYLRSGLNVGVRAALAASRRRFREALEYYRQMLPEYRHKAWIRTERARIFYVVGAHDSALVELNEALSELRQLDTARITQVYVSREMLEHAIGVIHQAAGDTAAARQAYGRALQENLAYASPHVLLAGLDLLGGDTTTALSEFEVAVQVAPAEAPLRVAYGLLLAQTGHREDAVVQLRRAAELEPYYATPYYLLGYVAELQGNREEALAGYRAFLARASARDRLHDMVAQRIVDLSP